MHEISESPFGVIDTIDNFAIACHARALHLISAYEGGGGKIPRAFMGHAPNREEMVSYIRQLHFAQAQIVIANVPKGLILALFRSWHALLY